MLGTIAGALEGLRSCGLVVVAGVALVAEAQGSCGWGLGLFLKKEGGKCLALYFSCTLSSSYEL